jgi:hypothetical protein
MAQYKVLQDIEAEDKLVGPLSLRQFIYAIIVIAIIFIGYQLGRVNFLLALPFLPPLVFFSLLAAPIGRTQSSEVWLLAKFRYWILPRKRIWDQFGQQELVKITVPKKQEEHLTKEFGKEEAESRLKALANTLDTRGWAVKNVTTEMFQRSASFSNNQSDDRLINIDSIPKDAAESTPSTSDVLDPTANPVAAKLDTMISVSDSTHRQQLMAKMQALAAQDRANQQQQNTAQQAPQPQQPQAPQAQQPQQAMQAPAANQQIVQPQPTMNTEREIPTNQPIITHSKPSPAAIPTQPPQNKPQAAMTTPANTDILKDVKQDGRTSLEVKHDDSEKSDSDDEVVISLH